MDTLIADTPIQSRLFPGIAFGREIANDNDQRSIVYTYFLRLVPAIFIAIASSRWRALTHGALLYQLASKWPN